MFQLVKKSLGLLWKQKKVLILLVLLTVLFFSVRFPWNTLLEKTVKKIQKQSASKLRTDFESLSFNFFPPGVEVQNLSVYYKRKNLFLDRIQFSILLNKWLAFKRAWRLKLTKGNSFLYLDFWKKEKASEDNPEVSFINYFINSHSPSLDLELVNSFFPDIKAEGKAKLRFDYEGHLERMEQSKAFLSLAIQGVRLSQTEIQTHLGPLNLPPISWKEGEILMNLKEGELIFQKLRLGSPSDDFIVQVKGSGSLIYSYGSVRLNSYDLQLQMDVDKTFPVNLLDLMFAGYKEDKGSFFRYRLRVIGQGQQVPNMEQLEEF